jgi:hypothetical protein
VPVLRLHRPTSKSISKLLCGDICQWYRTAQIQETGIKDTLGSTLTYSLKSPSSINFSILQYLHRLPWSLWHSTPKPGNDLDAITDIEGAGLRFNHNPKNKKIPKRHSTWGFTITPNVNLNGRSSDFRIYLLPAPSQSVYRRISGPLRGSSPITAAGPYRIFTGFPIVPEGTTKLHDLLYRTIKFCLYDWSMQICQDIFCVNWKGPAFEYVKYRKTFSYTKTILQ